MQILTAEGFDPSAVRAERAPRSSRAAGSTRAGAAERPPRAPRGEHAARAPRAPRSEDRAPREDPRIERERAYALNPDQPVVATPASAANSSENALAPAATPPKRHGFGHGRPVPALLRKRSTSEPEKV